VGYRKKTALTKRVDLSAEGYYAMIRALRGADDDACQAALLGDVKTRGKVISTSGGEDDEDDEGSSRTETDLEFHNSAYTTEILVRGIESWNVDGDDEKVLPIDAHTVKEELTANDTKLLVKEITALGKLLDIKSKKRS